MQGNRIQNAKSTNNYVTMQDLRCSQPFLWRFKSSGTRSRADRISMECVVPIVKFWKVHFLHFLNPEDGGTKPLRSVIFTDRQGFKPISLLY